MASPSGRLRSSQQQVSLGEDTKVIVPGGLLVLQVGVNGARSLPDGDKVDVDLHIPTNNFAPNEYEELSIPPVLFSTKDENARGNRNGDFNGK